MVGPSISAYSSLQQMLVVSDGVVIFLGPSNTSYVDENYITREGRCHSKYHTVKGKDINKIFLGFKTWVWPPADLEQLLKASGTSLWTTLEKIIFLFEKLKIS